MILSGAGATVIPMATEYVCVGRPLSWTVAVSFAVPLAVVGVPEITPVDDARLSPAGRRPAAIDQLYGPVPPDACNVCEYGVPTIAEETSAFAIVRGGAATAMVTPVALVWLGLLASVRARLNEKFPLTVGVPERMPVEGASDTPEGS
jgi:hypothetical protein